MVIRMSFPFGHSVSCINEDTQQRRFPPFLSSRQAHPSSGRFRWCLQHIGMKQKDKAFLDMLKT